MVKPVVMGAPVPFAASSSSDSARQRQLHPADDDVGRSSRGVCPPGRGVAGDAPGRATGFCAAACASAGVRVQI